MDEKDQKSEKSSRVSTLDEMIESIAKVGQFDGFVPSNLDEVLASFRRLHELLDKNKYLEHEVPQLKEFRASEPTEEELKKVLTSGSFLEKRDVVSSLIKKHEEMAGVVILKKKETEDELKELKKGRVSRYLKAKWSSFYIWFLGRIIAFLDKIITAFSGSSKPR